MIAVEYSEDSRTYLFENWEAADIFCLLEPCPFFMLSLIIPIFSLLIHFDFHYL